eukprot:Pgem_evm1s1148
MSDLHNTISSVGVPFHKFNQKQQQQMVFNRQQQQQQQQREFHNNLHQSKAVDMMMD